MRRIVFVYPGDLDTATGGYAYDRKVIAALRRAGRAVDLLHLAGEFPTPSPAEAAAAVAALAAVPADAAILADGLAFSTLPADALAAVHAPIIALIHHPLALETGVDPARAPMIAATERAALAHAAAVVVTSPATGATLTADYGVVEGALTVALPGLDEVWHRVERRPVSPPLIVSVGSLIPRKGHEVLVEALALIADRPWTAAICGGFRDAATVALVRGAIAAAGLADRIALPGEVDDAMMLRLYAEASVFALATRYEGFGMVFAEAMAAGLPVVATAGGAVPDVVPNEAGFVVPVDDAAAVADALARILGDAALGERFSRGGRAAARALPGWDETARLIAAAIDRLA